MTPVIYICDVCGEEIKEEAPIYYLNPYYLKVRHSKCPEVLRLKEKQEK